jgi:hypothetical protein
LILYREVPSSDAGQPGLRKVSGQHLARGDW